MSATGKVLFFASEDSYTILRVPRSNTSRQRLQQLWHGAGPPPPLLTSKQRWDSSSVLQRARCYSLVSKG